MATLDFKNPLNQTATIPNGSSVSNAITRKPGTAWARLAFPTAMTGTAITFETSHDGGTTWHNCMDWEGNAVTLAFVAAAGSPSSRAWAVAIPQGLFQGCTTIRIRSGTAASPTNEGAARDFILSAE